jgi:hypothetical protein
MLNDKYNYSLNGIEHEIILNHTLKFDQKPINEKILVSNKYLLKYINDLFDFHSIEYCLVNNSLLGLYVFKGINIFNSTIEICTLDSNFFKLKKIEDEIKKDDFIIEFNEKNIKLSTSFFDKIKVTLYIYPLENEINNDMLTYKTFDNKIIYHKFYDVFPIKKYNFEEFNISVPNKIEKILESYNFNLNYIAFTKNKLDNKKIIEEEPEKITINNIIKDNINNIISIIKPFLFSE